MDLDRELGSIDIYLLDQWLRGAVGKEARVLDAGCGRGRNLRPFLLGGSEVWVLEPDLAALQGALALAEELGTPIHADRQSHRKIEEAELPESTFDFIICNAVLHFATDADHFLAMTSKLFSWLKPGGRVFSRLATSEGLSGLIEPCPDRAAGWGKFPDGDEYFLSDFASLLDTTARLGAEIAEPIKTVNVQNRRAMATWVWQRPH